jgi:hypothetical protein
VPGTGDPTWLGVTEPDGVTDGDDEADRLGLGLGDGVRVEVGVVVGAGAVLELPEDWPDPADDGGGGGRTRRYSANTARNSTVSTAVEIRGHLMARCRRVRREPLMKRPRWRGRCQDRRRR